MQSSVINAPNEFDFSEIERKAAKFFEDLRRYKKETIPDGFTWYGYNIAANIGHISRLLTGANRNIFQRVAGLPIADIGAADGDLGFLFDSIGFELDLIDNPATNWNGMKASSYLKSALKARANIHEIDLDRQFVLPRKQYGLVFLLGILYHLKNPFYVMEHLAGRTKFCIVSTRIAKFTEKKNLPIREESIAYLLAEDESNNDPTNFWIFSETGLRRLVHRTGWNILEYLTVGDTANSSVADSKRDERAVLLLESRHFTS